MKKKLICTLVVAAMLITSVACGNKAEDNTLADLPSDNEVLKEEAQPVAEEEPAEKPLEKPLDLLIVPVGYSQFYGSNSYASVKYNTIAVTNTDDYPKLADALEQFNASNSENYEEQFNTFREEFATNMDEFSEYGYINSIENTIKVVRNDNNVLSFWEQCFGYSGGAHGYYALVGYNYDMTTGDEITLDQVVLDEDKLVDAVIDYLKTNDSERWQGIIDYDYIDTFDDQAEATDPEASVRETLKQYMTGEYGPCSFCLAADGLHVYIETYIIGSYAMGDFEPVISYEKYPDVVNSSFAPKNDNQSEPTCSDTKIRELVPVEDETGLNFGSPRSDGELWAIATEDEYEMYKVTLGYGDRVLYREKYGSCYNLRLFEAHTSSGQVYAFLERTHENDYRSIQVTDMKGVSTLFDGGFGTEEDSPSDTESFKLWGRTDSISSFSYTVDAYIYDGRIYTSGDMQIQGDWEFTAKEDIVACESYYYPEEDTVTIKKGKKFKPLQQADRNAVLVRAEDGTQGWIIFTKDPETYETLINGISLYDVIDGVVFAG